jgi:hypothetical protein
MRSCKNNCIASAAWLWLIHFEYDYIFNGSVIKRNGTSLIAPISKHNCALQVNRLFTLRLACTTFCGIKPQWLCRKSLEPAKIFYILGHAISTHVNSKLQHSSKRQPRKLQESHNTTNIKDFNKVASAEWCTAGLHTFTDAFFALVPFWTFLASMPIHCRRYISEK